MRGLEVISSQSCSTWVDALHPIYKCGVCVDYLAFKFKRKHQMGGASTRTHLIAESLILCAAKTK